MHFFNFYAVAVGNAPSFQNTENKETNAQNLLGRKKRGLPRYFLDTPSLIKANSKKTSGKSNQVTNQQSDFCGHAYSKTLFIY